MRMKTIAFAVVGAAMLPGSASAVQVAGELLEIYGKVHLSADFYDTDGGRRSVSKTRPVTVFPATPAVRERPCDSDLVASGVGL